MNEKVLTSVCRRSEGLNSTRVTIHIKGTMLVYDCICALDYLHEAVVKEAVGISIHFGRRCDYWRLAKKLLFAVQRKNHNIYDSS